jgi:hypothetical protein
VCNNLFQKIHLFPIGIENKIRLMHKTIHIFLCIHMLYFVDIPYEVMSGVSIPNIEALISNINKFTHESILKINSIFHDCQISRFVCLIYVICACLHVVVSNTYCMFIVFLFLFFIVLCTLCCQFLCIVHFWLPLRYSLTFISIFAQYSYFHILVWQLHPH